MIKLVANPCFLITALDADNLVLPLIVGTALLQYVVFNETAFLPRKALRLRLVASFGEGRCHEHSDADEEEGDELHAEEVVGNDG
jgi:hypothetical protein